MSVKNGAELLDRLIKDIVSESAATYVSVLHTSPNEIESSTDDDVDQRAFKLPQFITILKERIHVLNPFTRTFLVSWITLLDSIPDLELISFLPSFLGGLLKFLSDVNQDVHTTTKVALDRFLLEIRKVASIKRDITFTSRKSPASVQRPLSSDTKTSAKSDPNVAIKDAYDSADEAVDDDSQLEEEYIPGQDVQVDYVRILDILLSFLSDTSEEEIQTTTLGWIEQFFDICPDDINSFVPRLLSQVLPALSHHVEKVRQAANRVNDALTTYIMSLPEEPLNESETDVQPNRGRAPTASFDYEAAVHALTLQFLNEHEASRVAAISWLIMLHRKSPRKILAIHEGTFPALLKTLSDPSQAVVTRDLLLLSQICKNSDDSYFTVFMVSLLKLFCTDRKLLETRGNLIIRQLCMNLSAERIYRTLADCLERDEDLEFASIMVQNLNNNLITAPELAELRKRLRNLDTKEGQTFFITLFKSWCHNAVATFSLCLLAQAYEQAYHLLQIFTDLEMTVNMLIQIDKLVQLLESPVFTYLRLQLLEPERYPHLYKCMYGVLMLLPQSSAFAALKNRLNSVSAIGYLHIAPRNAPTTPGLGGTFERPARLKSRDESAIKWNELLEKFRSIQDRARRVNQRIQSPLQSSGLNIHGIDDDDRHIGSTGDRQPAVSQSLSSIGSRPSSAASTSRNTIATPSLAPQPATVAHQKNQSSLSQLNRFRVSGKSKKTT